MRRLSSLAALLFLVAACLPSTPQTASTGPGATANPPAKIEQTLVMATSLFAPTMDPHASITGSVRRYDMYETLVVQDLTGKSSLPMLAKEWKLVDPTTWEFTLVAGRKFHDSSPVTADDVIFSYTRAADPAKSYNAGTRLTTVASVTGSDTTVTVKTKQPDPILPKRMANLAILPKAAFEKAGEDAFFKSPIGSGPFRFKEFVPDDRAVVTGWKEHPSRAPKLETVTIRNVPEAAQRLNGLRTGAIDWASALPIDELDRLKKDGYQIHIRQAGVSGSYNIDTLSDTPFKDKRVRQAINYGIDKEQITRSIYAGIAYVEKGQISQRTTFGFDPSIEAYPYDLAKAKQLLAAAGYPNGFDTVLDVWLSSKELQSVAQYVQQQLREIGVKIEINGYTDFATFVDKSRGIQKRSPLANGAPGTAPQMDAEVALAANLCSRPEVVRRYCNPEFDAVVAAASKEMDPAKREKLLQDAAKIFREEAPVLFLVEQAGINAYTSKIKGDINRDIDDFMLNTVERIG